MALDMIKVAEEINALEKDGRVDPKEVIQAARNRRSAMHEWFLWDTKEAAEAHWINQARQLIRRVKVEVQYHDVPLKVVRYVRDVEDGATGYRNITMISEETLARQTVLDEMERVSKAARRARGVAIVLGTKTDLEQIEALARSVIARVRVTDQPKGSA